MRLRTSVFALAIAVVMAALNPTSVRAQSVDPCTVYLCMAGISGFGASGGPGCASALAYWHSALAVYSPYFNPPQPVPRFAGCISRVALAPLPRQTPPCSLPS